MGMSCSGTCGMAIMLIINILFFLLGLALVVVGILFIVQNDILLEDDVVTMLNDVTFSGSIYMGDILENLAIYTICLGGVILIISALGAIGACFKVRCMLIVYAVICILLVIAQAVCLALWLVYRDKMVNDLDEDLTTVLAKYKGYDTSVTDKKSKGWNKIFIDLECCGAKAANPSNDEFSGSEWASTRGSKKIPVSCCQSATKSNYKTHTDSACTDSYTNYNTKGCSDALEEEIKSYDTAVIIVCVLLIVVEMVNDLDEDLTTVLAKYKGYDTSVTDKKSKGWNKIFIDLECCGAKAANPSNDEFSGSEWASTRGSKKIPVSCCQSATKSNYKTHTDSACTDSYTNYNTKGCSDALEEEIKSYDTAVIIVCVLLIVVEIIGIIAACLQCRSIKKGHLV